MPDMKKLLSPKVIVPIIGLIVLITVATLVAVFYIRNPTVTDSIFSSGESVSSTPGGTDDGADDGEHRIEAVTAGNAPSMMSSQMASSADRPAGSAPAGSAPSSSASSGFAATPATTTVASTAPDATTAASTSTTTEDAQDTTIHAIEPVEHV